MSRVWRVVAFVVGFGVAGSARTWADDFGYDIASRFKEYVSRSHDGEVRVMTDLDSLRILNQYGTPVAGLMSDHLLGFTGSGALLLTDPASNPRVIAQVEPTGYSGLISVYSSAGLISWQLSGDFGLYGPLADVAEAFPVVDEALAQGSVMVLDETTPGSLRQASQAYDRRVAGIIAGANDYKPGVTLGVRKDGVQRRPVTLSGTVYCLATAANGPIQVGDLLTTSGVRGHAMKVTDHAAAQGAIIGKAMQPLPAGEGLILVLASLQ